MATILTKQMLGSRSFGRLTSSNPSFFARRFSSHLFVSRLSSYTTDEELQELFSPFGTVTEARLVRDQRTQRPKGFGFVSYGSAVEAQKALKAMNGRIVGGRLIFVEVANTTRPEEKNFTS